MCLLCLIIELTVAINEFSFNCLLINFEKQFSNFLIIFLKKDLFVIHCKNQIRDKAVYEAFDVTRIRLTFSEIDDLN